MFCWHYQLKRDLRHASQFVLQQMISEISAGWKVKFVSWKYVIFYFMMLIVPALTIRQEDDTLSINEVYKDFKYGRRHRPINWKICKYHIRVVSFQHCPRKGICQIFNMRQRVQTCSTWTKTKYFDIAGYLVLKYVVQKGKKVL